MVKINEDLVSNYLKQIEEAVFEEGNIVTYKSLTRLLNVHVNNAKQLLSTFKLQCKGEWKDSVSCTYFISGIRPDGSHVVTVVNEKDMDEVKSSLKEVFSEHVFSIQRMKYIEDFQVLVGVEKFPADSSISPINCSESLKITERSVTQAVKTTSSDVTVKKEMKKDQGKSPVKIKVEPVSAAKSTTREDEKQKKSPVKKGGPSISAMFSAQNQKAKVGSDEKKKPETAKAKLSSANVEKTIGKVDLKDTKKEVKEGISKQSPSNLNSNKVEKEDMKEMKESKGKQSNKSTANKTKKTVKKTRDKQKDKKRKRIQVFSDSEDSDQEISREKSPSPEPEPQVEAMIIGSDQEEEAQPESQPGHKKKRRKIVDKHVMNDDGYMETKKEVVFETDSEEEKNPAVSVKPSTSAIKKSPPEVKKVIPSKQTSPTKKGGKGKPTDGKKQASLLSFFKKT